MHINDVNQNPITYMLFDGDFPKQKLRPSESYYTKQVIYLKRMFNPCKNFIYDVMISVFALSVVYCEFNSWPNPTKENKIGICCSSAKQASLRRKSKDMLARNQDDVSEWSNMFTSRLLFQ